MMHEGSIVIVDMKEGIAAQNFHVILWTIANKVTSWISLVTHEDTWAMTCDLEILFRVVAYAVFIDTCINFFKKII